MIVLQKAGLTNGQETIDSANDGHASCSDIGWTTTID